MFPTLREMCQELDQKLGFNVEIKYPNDLEVSFNVNKLFKMTKLEKQNLLGRHSRGRQSH